MRLSAIVLGGIIGAAATLYVSRKRPGAVAWAANAMSNVCESVAQRSVSMLMNMDWKKEETKLSSKPKDEAAGASSAAWDQIEAFVKSDPELKREINQIKAESSSLSH